MVAGVNQAIFLHTKLYSCNIYMQKPVPHLISAIITLCT